MIEVKVSAASIDELSDKLLAMGKRLTGIPVSMVETPVIETGETPAEEPEAKAPTKGTKPANKPKEAPKAEETAEENAEAFTDYDRDVVPVVLETIKRVGRDAVVAVLDEYGVTKADQIDDELWPELVAKLRDL